METKYDVVIVGAGPAGLACAIGVARKIVPKGKSVLLLEKNEMPGKKLLMTGTGQCNLTHSGHIDDFFLKYGATEKGRFVKAALLNFTNRALCTFFNQRGVSLEETDGGKIFPTSRKSKDILETLCRECAKLGVSIATSSPIIAVQKTNGNNPGFLVRTHKGQIQAGYLVLATGGRSFPSTGSTGDGFRFAESLGHSITPIRPSLTPIAVRDYRLAQCSGIAVAKTKISLLEKPATPQQSGKILRSAIGAVLMTHNGFSGPGILDFSRFLAPGDSLVLNWLSDTTSEWFDRHLQTLFVENSKRTVKNTLITTGLPERMIAALLDSGGVNPQIQSSVVDKPSRRKIVTALTAYHVKVESLGDFREAMCTAGGVTLKEIDSRKMRSKIVPNLYFCGEQLDIDGDTGGYNLQFAFSSGFLAGDAIGQCFCR